MNKNVVIILIGAICTAFLVAMLVQSLLKTEPVADGAPVMAMTEVLVANEKLSEGEEAEAGKLEWREWPEVAVIKGFYVRSGDEEIKDLDIVGKPVRREVQAGEPVSSSVIVEIAKDGGNFMAATLNDGMLAFSIPVTAASSVGGFAGPGDHVDVILTYNVRIPKDAQLKARGRIQKYASDTILQNVRVLAVDQTSKEEDREAKVGKVVTLEVPPKGAEILSLAMEMGEITLALRRLGNGYDYKAEKAAAPTTDIAISKIMQQLEKPVDETDARQPRSDNGYTTSVRIYRGGQIESVTVPLAPNVQ